MVIGDTIGSYTIIAKLGEGGMGQVWRATDTKLDRDVAIKVLPEAFAHDADRLARFTREAKTLAALNHPNIAQIHGLEESSGITALVMELVEGDDLSQRIARLRAPGASARQIGMPLDEALPIAKQIAEALEAAHAGDHPSRSEARQHQGARRRHGEDSGHTKATLGFERIVRYR